MIEAARRRKWDWALRSGKLQVRRQGDQIGRIFAYRVIIFLGIIVKITKGAQNSGRLFSTEKVLYSFWQKMGLATFWAIFQKLTWSPCSPLP
jgi:hypothetical protein